MECAPGAGSMGTLDLLNIKASHFPGHVIKAILIFTRSRTEDILLLSYAQLSISCPFSMYGRRINDDMNDTRNIFRHTILIFTGLII